MCGHDNRRGRRLWTGPLPVVPRRLRDATPTANPRRRWRQPMTVTNLNVADAEVSATPLVDFLRQVRAQGATLTLDDRRLIVGQALVLLEHNYVHLPVKAAMYSVNPVQR